LDLHEAGCDFSIRGIRSAIEHHSVLKSAFADSKEARLPKGATGGLKQTQDEIGGML
jgi:hypothetical protein